MGNRQRDFIKDIVIASLLIAAMFLSAIWVVNTTSIEATVTFVTSVASVIALLK